MEAKRSKRPFPAADTGRRGGAAAAAKGGKASGSPEPSVSGNRCCTQVVAPYLWRASLAQSDHMMPPPSL